jgi:hypothetical protein
MKTRSLVIAFALVLLAWPRTVGASGAHAEAPSHGATVPVSSGLPGGETAVHQPTHAQRASGEKNCLVVSRAWCAQSPAF